MAHRVAAGVTAPAPAFVAPSFDANRAGALHPDELGQSESLRPVARVHSRCAWGPRPARSVGSYRGGRIRPLRVRKATRPSLSPPGGQVCDGPRRTWGAPPSRFRSARISPTGLHYVRRQRRVWGTFAAAAISPLSLHGADRGLLPFRDEERAPRQRSRRLAWGSRGRPRVCRVRGLMGQFELAAARATSVSNDGARTFAVWRLRPSRGAWR